MTGNGKRLGKMKARADQRTHEHISHLSFDFHIFGILRLDDDTMLVKQRA